MKQKIISPLLFGFSPRVCLFTLFALFALFISACNAPPGSTVAQTAEQCLGVYYTTDADGNLYKWNQFHTVNDPTCLTENLSLSQWQITSQKFVKHLVKCVPQSASQFMTLTSSNNYYTYRDGRILLDLDASTGIYRRIELGQNSDGSIAFSRNEGCFYWRTGTGVDASFGTQLLLDNDVPRWASSSLFQALEIFRVDTVDSIVSMTRFDNTSGWNYAFCPYMSVPETYCAGLDNGNIFYYPTLTADQQVQLLAEAILIRTQFNYVSSSRADFENQWAQIDSSLTETSSDAFLYIVVGSADVPLFIDQAWHNYLTRARTHMPDVTSNKMRDICYPGSESVTLTNGSLGRIFGEICYTSGVYSFTQE